jgi:ribosomal protein S20
MKQYYYELDCSAVMCYFIIKINDVEVFSLNVEGQIASDIPINNGILEKGSHTIEITMLPLLGEKELHKEAYVRYKVIEYDVSSGDFKYLNQFEEQHTTPVKKGIPFIKQVSVFNANVNYKLDAWQNSQNIKELEIDVKKELIKKYNEIINEINSGQFDKVISKMKKKFENLAISMYLNKNEAEQKVSNLLSDFKEGFKAQKLTGTEIVQYAGNNKLACLKKANGKHALNLINDKKEEMDLMFYFYVPKGKTELEFL